MGDFAFGEPPAEFCRPQGGTQKGTDPAAGVNYFPLIPARSSN
jgi:hypothetical protein